MPVFTFWCFHKLRGTCCLSDANTRNTLLSYTKCRSNQPSGLSTHQNPTAPKYINSKISPTHQLINSLTHHLTNSPTQKLINSKLKNLAHQLTNSQTYKLTNLQTHKLTNLQTHKLTNSQTHKLINSQTHKLKLFTLFYNATLILAPF